MSKKFAGHRTYIYIYNYKSNINVINEYIIYTCTYITKQKFIEICVACLVLETSKKIFGPVALAQAGMMPVSHIWIMVSLRSRTGFTEDICICQWFIVYFITKDPLHSREKRCSSHTSPGIKIQCQISRPKSIPSQRAS